MGHGEAPVPMVQPAAQVCLAGIMAFIHLPVPIHLSQAIWYSSLSHGTQIWWLPLISPCRVVLFDDDAHKACPGEEGNMIRVPCWDDNNGQCMLIKELVESVLEVSSAGPGWCTTPGQPL